MGSSGSSLAPQPMIEAADVDVASAHDPEIERAFLGGIFAGASLSVDIHSEDIYLERHRAIYRACLSLEAVDVPSVVAFLRDCDDLERVGGATYVSSIADDLPDVVNTDQWAKTIIEYAMKRNAAKIGRRLLAGESPELVKGELQGIIDRLAGATGNEPQFVIEPFSEVANLDIPERDHLLAPWLPERGLAMVYSPKGGGKTSLGTTVAVGISAGVDVFGWAVRKPHIVVYIDGELELVELRERVAAICRGLELDDDAVGRVGQNLFILSRERMATLGINMGYINSPTVQSALNQALPPETSLVVFDNLSCLFGGEENDAAAWDDILMFMLGLKHDRGITSLFQHHSGKGGDQRGTSRREDNLDTSLRLVPIIKEGELTADNTKFRIVWAKHRGFRLRDAPSIVCELDYNRDEMVAKWTITRTDDVRIEALVEEYGTYKRKHGAAPTVRVLHKLMTERAEDEGRSEFRVSSSTVHNLLTKARAEGLLEER